MKYVKMLGFAAVAAAALMAFVGLGSASATTLTSPSGTGLGVGKELTASNEGTLTLTGGFKNIECQKGTVGGKITNAGGASATVSVTVETLTFTECNCEVVVVTKGSLELHYVAGSFLATITATSSTITISCFTIFGNVHCAYLANNTILGSLKSSSLTGTNAKIEITSELPRENTNALCSEESILHEKYTVKVPGSSNENFLDVD